LISNKANGAVEIAGVIASTGNYTVSLGIASLPCGNSRFPLYYQRSSGGGTETNHFLTFSEGIFSSDEFAPSGNSVIFDDIKGTYMPNVAITVRRTNETMYLFFNGLLVNTKPVFETYSGPTPTITSIGNRTLNSQTSQTLAVGSIVMWQRSLSDTEVRLLTYNNITTLA